MRWRARILGFRRLTLNGRLLSRRLILWRLLVDCECLSGAAGHCRMASTSSLFVKLSDPELFSVICKYIELWPSDELEWSTEATCDKFVLESVGSTYTLDESVVSNV